MPQPVAPTLWPDAFDLTTIGVFFAVALGLPVSGYVFMVVDYLAWLRALRGALVKVAYCFPETPHWTRWTPVCLRALGLRAPCSEADVKQAYRRLAQRLHPDRGGDTRRFLAIQRHFEAALRYVRQHQPPRGEKRS